VSKCTDMLPSLVSMVNHAGTLTCSPSSTSLSDIAVSLYYSISSHRQTMS
jgi:hypothetical protein